LHRSVIILPPKGPQKDLILLYLQVQGKNMSKVELEGLEAEYIFNKAKQELANDLQALANKFDNSVSVFNNSSSSTVVQSGPLTTTSVGTTVTTTAKANLSGNMSYIIANNSNAGNTESLTKTTTTVAADIKTETNTPVVSMSKKESMDNTGVATNETGYKAKAKIDGVPLTVAGSGSTSSDGQNELTAQGAKWHYYYYQRIYCVSFSIWRISFWRLFIQCKS
jgi:hypothetical protein